jgi:hypothetical protein
MNQQIKVLGHLLRYELQNNLAAQDLVVVICVVFLVAQPHHLQQEIITCMKMSRKL